MGNGKKGGSGSGQLKCGGGAPDFARATGMPKAKQLGGTAQGRAPNSGQTRMPADQGGRAGSKKD